MGACHTIDATDPEAIKRNINSFDLIIATVGVTLDWPEYVNTLKAKGRLHFVGIPLQPMEIGVIALLRGQKSVSASPVGSPGTISRMLDFAAFHNIKPAVEEYNIAPRLTRLYSGCVAVLHGYRVVIAMNSAAQ